MYRHIVLFRVHDGVTEQRVTEAVRLLRSLAALPGVISWRVERSLDTRKGTVIVEDAIFMSAEALSAFRAHPSHVRAGHHMAKIADWSNGDFEI